MQSAQGNEHASRGDDAVHDGHGILSPEVGDPPQAKSRGFGADEKHVDEKAAATTENGNGPTAPGESSGDERKEEFKEGGYGWVVVLCVFLNNAHTWGINSSYAVFLAYYLNDSEFANADPIVFAFIGGLSFSLALLISPIVTTCNRIFGNKRTYAVGVVIQAGALVGASFTSKLWHLVLSQGVGFGIGMGFTFNATVGVVPQYFYRRRSFANALATGGTGFGGLIYSLATNAMIQNIGLPWAFRVLAIVSFAVMSVCCVLFRDRNKAVGSVMLAFHWSMFRRIEFWLFLIWGIFNLFGYVVVVFSISDYGRSVGFTASQSSIAIAIFNLSQCIGRPAIGLLSDRFGRLNVCGICTLLGALSTFFLWIFAGPYYPGIIVYALCGAFCGCLWPTVAPVGAEVVGLKMLPSALSIFWLVLVLPATFAQPIALAIKGPGVDGYLNVQILTGFVFLIAFIAIWLLRVWKMRQLELADLIGAAPDEAGNNTMSRTTSRASTRTSTGRLVLRGIFSWKHRV